MNDMGSENIILKDGLWSIELRPRNNAHEGEPNMKVWVCMRDQEVAQYSSHYRGYGHYKDHEELLPPNIVAAAKKAWEMLTEGEYNQDMLDGIRSALKNLEVEE
ncbi:MAG: hypothetical protein K6B68_04870 [Eubacterium sp.]|nr:hypothetical protein [Eubacterium sp.]